MADSSNYTISRLTPLPMEPVVLFPFPLSWLNPVFFEKRDPRMMDFPLVRDIWPNILINGAYLFMVFIGPLVMRSFKAFNFQRFLIFYNFIMVAISGYILYECVYTAYLSSYSMFCQPIDFSTHPLALRMARVVWMYFFTRYIEFLDTLFFILRKKNGQLSFLHVYHHCSIAVTWWVTANVSGGGMMIHMVALNCFIHVIMYTYYGLSALGPSVQKYLWWKVHLTKLQLMQFVSMLILMGTNTTCDDPNFPQFLNYIGVGYCSTILGLFLNFYIQTYFKKKRIPTKALQKNGTARIEENGKEHTKIEHNGKEHNGHVMSNGKHEPNGTANGKKHD